MADSPLSRRRFLQKAGAAAAGVSAMSAASYENVWGANDRLRIGVVGCGGMGNAHFSTLLDQQTAQNVRVTAVCDVFEQRAREFQAQAKKQGQETTLYTDHRAMLEEEDLEYVVVATPEHWHQPITLDALDAGLHVYCEKPMTRTLEEAKAVVDRVDGTDRKLQVGVQGMSDDSYVSARQAIRDGLLGPVIEAQIEYVRWHSLEQGPWRTDRPDEEPKPEDLDWERWLGPAPPRPWDPNRYHEWRNYVDYSGGIATDLFIHRLTRILKACDLRFPRRIVGMGGIYLWNDGRELPDNLEMLAEYPAVEGITPGMTVHILGTMGNDRGIDHLIRGHAGTLEFTSSGWTITSQTSGEVIETHEKTGAEDIGLHHENLQAAIRTGEELRCPPELGLYGVAAVEGINRSWFQDSAAVWDAVKNQWEIA